MTIKILTIINAILILIYSIGAYFVLPEFERLFDGFGSDLPVVTFMVMESYRYWAVFLIVPLLVYRKCSSETESPEKTDDRLMLFTVSMFIFLLLFIPIITWVMYLPIIKMGAIVDG